MKVEPEPELIDSPLSRSMEWDGVRLDIQIYRLATERGWTLEVINERGTSIVWDDPFASDRDADAAFRDTLVQGLKTWLADMRSKSFRATGTAEAIGYVLNQWKGLVRFLDDGRIELDTNAVERSMRPVALQRKNALFAGHDLGADNWATIVSLVETCKLGGINPQAYLADVLARIVTRTDDDPIDDLLPYNWVDSRTPERAADIAAAA